MGDPTRITALTHRYHWSFPMNTNTNTNGKPAASSPWIAQGLTQGERAHRARGGSRLPGRSLALPATLLALAMLGVFAGTAYAAPTVESESVNEVLDTAVTLQGAVNIESSGAYYFEYGTTEGYSSRVPAGEGALSAGAGTATEQLQGLSPSTTYHYRIVVTAGGETTVGEPASFTTQPAASSFLLPDDRAWEMVSPPEKAGARVEAITKEGAIIQAAQDGSAITYVANSPIVHAGEEPEGNRSVAYSQILARRHAGGSWSTRDITIPETEVISKVTGLLPGHLGEYYAFDQNLDKGLAEPRGAPQLAANAKENSMFIRENLFQENSRLYTALLNENNTPPNTHYGEQHEPYIAASANLQHIAFISRKVALDPQLGINGLYEWSNGVIHPVSFLPNETPATERQAIGYQNRIVRGAVSENGELVFWEATTQDKATFEHAHLFMRNTVLEKTVQIDLPQGTPEPVGAANGAQFQLASPDGERVYFTSDQKLTADSTALPAEPELYEYDTTTGALQDLSVNPEPVLSANVQGDVIGGGSTGGVSHVYFVAHGVLAAGAEEGAANLYVAEVQGASVSVSLIAVLAPQDVHDWEETPNHPKDLSGVTSRVSPDGGFLAFMSLRRLTGYDNTDAVEPSAADEEVFEYDAATGRVVCASCDPTGARPHGVFDTKVSGEGIGLLVDRRQIWLNHWLSGSLPAWTGWELRNADYQSRYLSDSGRLFFDSSDGLVSKDTNQKEDVYEFEPVGVGSGEVVCSSSSGDGSEVYRAGRAYGPGESEGRSGEEGSGCVALISSGGSSHESAFLDASETGGDVFFMTAAQLTASDSDGSYDVYDAHSCTAEVPCNPAAPVAPGSCTETSSCSPGRAPAAALEAPLSSVFQGEGNVPPQPPVVVKKPTRGQQLAKALAACTKRPKARRKACRAEAQKRYGAKKASRAARHR